MPAQGTLAPTQPADQPRAASLAVLRVHPMLRGALIRRHPNNPTQGMGHVIPWRMIRVRNRAPVLLARPQALGIPAGHQVVLDYIDDDSNLVAKRLYRRSIIQAWRSGTLEPLEEQHGYGEAIALLLGAALFAALVGWQHGGSLIQQWQQAWQAPAPGRAIAAAALVAAAWLFLPGLLLCVGLSMTRGNVRCATIDSRHVHATLRNGSTVVQKWTDLRDFRRSLSGAVARFADGTVLRFGPDLYACGIILETLSRRADATAYRAGRNLPRALAVFLLKLALILGLAFSAPALLLLFADIVAGGPPQYTQHAMGLLYMAWLGAAFLYVMGVIYIGAALIWRKRRRCHARLRRAQERIAAAPAMDTPPQTH